MCSLARYSLLGHRLGQNRRRNNFFGCLGREGAEGCYWCRRCHLSSNASPRSERSWRDPAASQPHRRPWLFFQLRAIFLDDGDKQPLHLLVWNGASEAVGSSSKAPCPNIHVWINRGLLNGKPKGLGGGLGGLRGWNQARRENKQRGATKRRRTTSERY